ncbi:MAG: hypothetical protein WCF57_20320 [Pyrinomonadaceae bacterium]
MDFERCSEDCSQINIVVGEMGRQFRINNANRLLIKKVQVDGCLIDDERLRCDYLFEIEQATHCIIYLELKGSDLDHAFRQLVATMGYCGERHKSCKRVCHIVASRVPRAGPKVQTLKRMMVQKYRTLLYVNTQVANIDVTQHPYNS